MGEKMKKTFIVYTFVLVFIVVFSFGFLRADETKRIVYLDAGHGGIDGGAVGIDGTRESEINLLITKKLQQILIDNGYTVYLTRDGDYDLASSSNTTNRKSEDIRKRVSLINQSKADIYVSIHTNSFSNATIHGAQTFYKSGNNLSETLAKDIQKSLIDNLKNTSREAKTIENKYLIDNTTVPGCIVEVGFITNPEELALLKTSEYQEKIANAIYLGIYEYFKS